MVESEIMTACSPDMQSFKVHWTYTSDETDKLLNHPVTLCSGLLISWNNKFLTIQATFSWEGILLLAIQTFWYIFYFVDKYITGQNYIEIRMKWLCNQDLPRMLRNSFQ